MGSWVRKFVAVTALAVAVLGVAAPSWAAERAGKMTRWHDGDRSGSWHDKGKNGAITKVVFTARCKHDFVARIRLESRFRPDKTRGSERINCTSYDDAVVGGNLGSGDYHFDVQEFRVIGNSVYYPDLTGSYKVHW